jgi:phosphodiesterase/alkaline phosphatase D-like protein
MLMRRVSTTELYLMPHLHKRLNNSGGKKAKDRITVMVACNTHRNKNAWLTGDIFSEWLHDFNKDMRHQ